MDTSYLIQEAYQIEGGKQEKFYNRDLAILDFNERVLTLTEDPLTWKHNPKNAIYLDIVYRNIIEFIQVRLPRCNLAKKTICLKYIQELFAEMGRLADLADLEHDPDIVPLQPYELEACLKKELVLDNPPEPMGCYYGTVNRSIFDLFRYHGETESELLKEFIWLSSQDKVHIQQESLVGILVGPREKGYETYLPILYLPKSALYALTWYREATELSGSAKRAIEVVGTIFDWKDSFDTIFKYHMKESIPAILSTPRRGASSITESYKNTVVGAIEYMCELDSVYLICMTLYRVAKNSRIVEALIKAAMMGKKVMVYVEVMARGNEIANVAIINRLREAGISVYHTFGGYKIHAKMFGAFIRNEPAFAILSTGNFNEDSAESYTDMHYFTRESIYTEAIFNLFLHSISSHDLSAVVGKGPFGSHFIRRRVVTLINRETSRGSRGRIWLKCNSLCDRTIIRALYLAAEAGVDVKILIRTGIGVGDTSTLPVYSKVGEYLEHERIYIFGESIYLSSADLMIRNLDRRVESFFEIHPTPEENHEILSNFLNDIDSATTRTIHWDQSIRDEIMADE